MDKAFYRLCIETEVDHWAGIKKSSLLRKIWLRFFQAESNAVYLVRKYQYHVSQASAIHKLRSRILEMKLMRRYGIFIGKKCTIGLGFRIWHPHGIIINNVEIGENFNVLQNCTIGDKALGEFKIPRIGNNVTMYANSMVIGAVNVEDNVVLAANACLLHDTEGSGVYVGIPAKIMRHNDNVIGRIE